MWNLIVHFVLSMLIALQKFRHIDVSGYFIGKLPRMTSRERQGSRDRFFSASLTWPIPFCPRSHERHSEDHRYPHVNYRCKLYYPGDEPCVNRLNHRRARITAVTAILTSIGCLATTSFAPTSFSYIQWGTRKRSIDEENIFLHSEYFNLHRNFLPKNHSPMNHRDVKPTHSLLPSSFPFPFPCLSTWFSGYEFVLSLRWK